MAENHKKPTKAELEAQAAKALEELENPPKETPSPSPEAPSPSPSPEEEEENTSPSPSPEAPSPSPSPEEEEEEIKPKPKKEEVKKEPDYKKKFVSSTQEAQILHAKNKKLNEAITNASNLPEPTEDELRHEYPNWDDMDDTTRRIAKESMVSTRRFKAIEEATKEFKDLDVWVEKVEAYVADPNILTTNPELEGKIDEFKMFATKPTRRGVDMQDLVNAFLFEAGKEKPKKKKAMFPTGSGGPNVRQERKSDMITLEEANHLMKTDYNKYKKYLNAKKIDFSSV